MIEGMAEPISIFCLRLDDAREPVLDSVITEALEEVDNVTADSIDTVVGWCTNNRLEGVGGGGKGSNILVRGQHVTWARMVVARAVAVEEKI